MKDNVASQYRATLPAREPQVYGSLGQPRTGGHPARAVGGLWLCRILVPSGLRALVVPSGLRVTVQPHWWMATQCRCLTH